MNGRILTCVYCGHEYPQDTPAAGSQVLVETWHKGGEAVSESIMERLRWRDVADELPQEAQEVLFVRGSKTLHGAWIGGIFWHSNQKMAAAYWMPLPLPPNADVTGLAPGKDEQ